MLKIGVLGCGMIAEWGHLPAIQHSDEVSLHALFDIRWQRTLDMQKRFAAKHAYPTEEAFWQCDFDVVVICSPAPLHLEHVTKAQPTAKISSAKNPRHDRGGYRVHDSDHRQAGVKLYTGFTYRFSPSAWISIAWSTLVKSEKSAPYA